MLLAAHGYPRPQLIRDPWTSLNGTWDCAIDSTGRWGTPDEVEWNSRILVPFAPETPASGLNDVGFFRCVWYKRAFQTPVIGDQERLILHFGAVDTHATVWVNGDEAVRHQGGYTPFREDITKLLINGEDQFVVVRAEDDPADLTKPRGKQDWHLRPHSIWYPRTTGIWQTVWFEVVPETYIDLLHWIPVVDRWELRLEMRVGGQRRDDLRLRVKMEVDGEKIVEDCYNVAAGEVHRAIQLSDPGIDDYRNELLWRPSHPTLIDAVLELIDDRDQVIDRVRSYTALRSIGIQGDRFVLNGRPFQLRMVLDQGYWPQTGMTPPDDAALQKDVMLVKDMGFTGVRRHQVLSDPRYLYWADRLGLLVWEEMPSAYRFTKRSVKQVCREWIEALERDLSHPCIIAWVPLNESWGVPDLPDSPAQRHYVQALYHLTKTLDSTRPVVGNDGWESVATDIIGIHDYEDQPHRLLARYGNEDRSIERIAARERPGGRLLLIDPSSHASKPIMLTEFGGIALSKDEEKTWGYSRVRTTEELAERYASLMSVVRSISLFSGFCYTQFADTYQETNGLLYADRTPKFPLEEIALATEGPRGKSNPVEAKWRERLMESTLQRDPIEDRRLTS